MIEEQVLKDLFKSHLGGRFEVRKILGIGGMGVVVQAYDSRLKVLRAIKVFNPALANSPEMRKRFENEAAVMAGIEHKHIARVFDAGEIGEHLFMILEWIDGGSLSDHLAIFGGMPPRQAVKLFLHLCDGLAEAHAQGIIHRDIKPDNILLTKSGVAKIADFGIAHVDTEAGQLTGAQQGIGTLVYMSPEQMFDAATVDVRADVHAMGVTLWAVLTAERPQGISFVNELECRADMLLGIPDILHSIIKKSVQYNPNDRHASIAEFSEDLADAFSHLPQDPDVLHPLGSASEFKETDRDISYEPPLEATHVSKPAAPLLKEVVVVAQATDWDGLGRPTRPYARGSASDIPVLKLALMLDPVVLKEDAPFDQPTQIDDPKNPYPRHFMWIIVALCLTGFTIFLLSQINLFARDPSPSKSMIAQVGEEVRSGKREVDAGATIMNHPAAVHIETDVSVAKDVDIVVQELDVRKVDPPIVASKIEIPKGKKLKGSIVLVAQKGETKPDAVVGEKPIVVEPKLPEVKKPDLVETAKVYISLQLPEDDTARVWFVGSSGRIKIPSNVPVGTYRIVAKFMDHPDEITVIQEYHVKPGTSPKVSCKSSFANCKVH